MTPEMEEKMWQDYKNHPNIGFIAKKYSCSKSTVSRLIKKMRERDLKIAKEKNNIQTRTERSDNESAIQKPQTSSEQNEIDKEIWNCFIKGEDPVAVVGKYGRIDRVNELYHKFLQMRGCNPKSLHETILNYFVDSTDSPFQKYHDSFKKKGYITNSEVMDIIKTSSYESYDVGEEDMEMRILYSSRLAPPEGCYRIVCSRCNTIVAAVRERDSIGKQIIAEFKGRTHYPSCPQ